MRNQANRRKQRQVRLSDGPTVVDWRCKVDPFFVKVAEQQKRINQLSRGSHEDRQEAQRLIRNPPAELKEEARRTGDEFRRTGKRLMVSASVIFTIDDRFPAAPDMPDEDYMLAWIAWNRYQKTFQQLLAEDVAGVRQSSKRILEVHREYQRWRYGEREPGAMKFKVDREHQALILCGWDFGIGSLSPEELAGCFDDLCSCGKAHDPENLRKFRTRMIRFVEAAG